MGAPTPTPNNGKGKDRAIDDENSEVGDDPSKGSVIKCEGSFITVLDTFKNIAPIVDAVLVNTDPDASKQTNEPDKSGQASASDTADGSGQVCGPS